MKIGLDRTKQLCMSFSNNIVSFIALGDLNTVSLVFCSEVDGISCWQQRQYRSSQTQCLRRGCYCVLHLVVSKVAINEYLQDCPAGIEEANKHLRLSNEAGG